MHFFRTILLVEEDRELRAVVRDLLERSGFWVIAALRAESTPRVCEMAATVDLLVSDVSVPDSDSLALTEELLSRHGDLSAVLIATDDTELDIRRRFTDHRTLVLPKPFSIKELRCVVEEALAVRPGSGNVSAGPPLSRRSVAWGLVAAAMVVFFAGAVMRVAPHAPPLPERVESTVKRGMALNGLTPTGDLPEMPARLRWNEVAGAAGYRIRIRTVDGTVLWQGASNLASVTLSRDAKDATLSRDAKDATLSRDAKDATLSRWQAKDVTLSREAKDTTDATLSREAKDALHPGVVYYWTVEALDTQGETQVRSKSARFQVVPTESRGKEQ